MTLAMQNDAKTVVQENEANLLGRTQQELAEGVSGVLKNKKNRMDQNLKRIAQMGIGGAKDPTWLLWLKVVLSDILMVKP